MAVPAHRDSVQKGDSGVLGSVGHQHRSWVGQALSTGTVIGYLGWWAPLRPPQEPSPPARSSPPATGPRASREREISREGDPLQPPLHS